MRATSKPLLQLTAADLMTRDVLCLPEELPLREAARRLVQSQVSGAPVVDAQGRCVGVLSAWDFARLAQEPPGDSPAAGPPRILTCSFLVKDRGPGGEELFLCALRPGACPIQERRQGPGGRPLTVCREPHAVHVDWQIVEVEKLPEDAVRRYMTADPVTCAPGTRIHVLARQMIDAHIHRVIVVVRDRKPVGVVSSTDVLAAVAEAGRRQETAAKRTTRATRRVNQ